MKNPIFVDDTHDYDLLIDNDVYTLFYSEGEQWSSNTRGKIAMEINDTGNGFEIIEGKPRTQNHFDYDEILFVSILTKIIFQNRKIELAEKIKI
jgi:hypothetical protein